MMRDREPRSLRGLMDRRWRLELAPFALFLASAWLKTSWFSFPPRQELGNDWNGWRLTEALQAGAGSLALLLLLCAPLLLVGRVRRYAVLWGIDLLATLVLLADLIHFRFYGDVLSITAASSAGQLPMVLASIAELLRAGDALLFADLVLGAVLFRRYARRSAALTAVDRPERLWLVRRVALTGLVLFLAVPVRIVVLDRGDTFRYGYFRFFGVRKIGLVNYHLYEAGKQSGSALARYTISDSERARALADLEAWRDTAAARSPLFGVARGSSVVFLMVESLQSFPLGLRIGGRPVTPHLNALADRSLVFENFYDQTWEGTTSDGEFTSLQSLHPLPSGSVPVRYAGSRRFRGIPEVLAERGYETFSAHAYYGDLWRMREMHPNLGFQRSVFLEGYEMTERVGEALSDGEFFRQTLPRIDSLARPFMAYLMTMSTHHPYEVPAHHRTLPLGELEGTLLGDYLHAVHYADAAVGTLVREMEASGLLEETVLVVYGDHQAELGNEEDFVRLLTHHAGLQPPRPGLDPAYWREHNRVPLLIHLPGDQGAGVRTVSGGHLDITPTVLNLLGVEDHRMSMLGRDLTRDVPSLVVLRDGGFVLADTLCLVPNPTVETQQCREITTGRALDPGGFRTHFDRARRRLEVSDILIRGDLVALP